MSDLTPQIMYSVMTDLEDGYTLDDPTYKILWEQLKESLTFIMLYEKCGFGKDEEE